MDYFSSLQEQHKEFLINTVPENRLRICHLQMNDDYDASHKYFWRDSFSDGIARLRTGIATLENAVCLLYPYKYLESERGAAVGVMVYFYLANCFLSKNSENFLSRYVKSEVFLYEFAGVFENKKHYSYSFDLEKMKAINDKKIFNFDFSKELQVLSLYSYDIVGKVKRPKPKQKLNKLHLQKEAILEEIKIQKMNPKRVNKKQLMAIFLEKYEEVSKDTFERAWQSLLDDKLIESDYPQKKKIKK